MGPGDSFLPPPGDGRCPWCGADNSAHTAISGTPAPSAGAISLCAYCYSPSVFDDHDGTLAQRMPTPAELVELESDPRITQARTVMRMRDLGRRLREEER